MNCQNSMLIIGGITMLRKNWKTILTSFLIFSMSCTIPNIVQGQDVAVTQGIFLKTKQNDNIQLLKGNINNYTMDKKYIYYTLMDDSGQVYRMNVDGSNNETFSEVNMGTTSSNSPYYYYSDNRYASIYNKETGEHRSLFYFSYSHPSAFSNGKDAYFYATIYGIPVTSRQSGVASGIYRVNDDFTYTKLPNSIESIKDTCNQYIYYSRSENDGSNILYRCNKDFSNEKKVTSRLFSDIAIDKDKLYIMGNSTGEKTSRPNEDCIVMSNLEGSNSKVIFKPYKNKKRIDSKHISAEGINFDCTYGSLLVIGEYIYFTADYYKYVENLTTSRYISSEYYNGIYRIKLDGTGFEEIVSQKSNNKHEDITIQKLSTDGQDLYFEIYHNNGSIYATQKDRFYNLYKLVLK